MRLNLENMKEEKKINRSDLLEFRNKLLVAKRDLRISESIEDSIDKVFFKKEAKDLIDLIIRDLEYFISIKGSD